MGTPSAGGRYFSGSVYKLDPNGNVTILHSFAGPDGAVPFAGMTRNAAGNLVEPFTCLNIQALFHVEHSRATSGWAFESTGQTACLPLLTSVPPFRLNLRRSLEPKQLRLRIHR